MRVRAQGTHTQVARFNATHVPLSNSQYRGADTGRTLPTSAAPCDAAASGMRACSSPTAKPSMSTKTTYVASSRRTANASRPVTERFPLGPSGHVPPLLLLGPLPASDEGQGLKAAPEAE